MPDNQMRTESRFWQDLRVFLGGFVLFLLSWVVIAALAFFGGMSLFKICRAIWKW